jgi:hypothetical protein
MRSPYLEWSVAGCLEHGGSCTNHSTVYFELNIFAADSKIGVFTSFEQFQVQASENTCHDELLEWWKDGKIWQRGKDRES